MLNNIQ